MRSQGKERPAHYWFSFVSDWLGKWREFFGQSHDEVNKKKTKQRRITFDTRWKIALLRCGLFLNCNRFFVFFNTFPRSPICLKIPKRQEVALMMSNEGAPPTSNLDGKRKRWEKTGIQRDRGRGRGGRKGPRRESNFNPRTNFRSKGRGWKRLR